MWQMSAFVRDLCLYVVAAFVCGPGRASSFPPLMKIFVPVKIKSEASQTYSALRQDFIFILRHSFPRNGLFVCVCVYSCVYVCRGKYYTKNLK